MGGTVNSNQLSMQEWTAQMKSALDAAASSPLPAHHIQVYKVVDVLYLALSGKPFWSPAFIKVWSKKVEELHKYCAGLKCGCSGCNQITVVYNNHSAAVMSNNNNQA